MYLSCSVNSVESTFFLQLFYFISFLRCFHCLGHVACRVCVCVCNRNTVLYLCKFTNCMHIHGNVCSGKGSAAAHVSMLQVAANVLLCVKWRSCICIPDETWHEVIILLTPCQCSTFSSIGFIHFILATY